MRIIFIGMPSSGKTTMGKLTAEKLNKEFFDTDFLIEQKERMSIPEIFEKKGEEYFRNKETEVLKEISDKNAVIATGGGTPVRKINQAEIQKNSFVIYLDRPLEDLSALNRPLSKDLNTLKKMYNDRRAIYEELSDKKIKVGNKDETLKLILEAIYENIYH